MKDSYSVPLWLSFLSSRYVGNKVRHYGIVGCCRKLPSYLLQVVILWSLLPLAVMLRIVLLCLKPMLIVRFGRIWCDRLAPFALIPELYLCEKDAGIKTSKGLDLWFHWDRDSYIMAKPIRPRDAVCNEQLNTMWQRMFRVHNFTRYLDRLNRLIGYGSNQFIVDIEFELADRRALLAKVPVHLNFSEDEEDSGDRALSSLGIGPDDKIVCFHARDSAYLNRERPRNIELYGDWSHQDVRDVSIFDYVPAMEALTELGYYAVRMGKYVEEPLKSSNPMIIDYASEGQSDLMDVYLSARCSFFVGQNSGMIALPQIFRKPLLIANIYPLNDIIYYSTCLNSLAITKKYYSRHWKRYLTMSEIYELGLGRPASQSDKQKMLSDDLGICVIDNDASEIMSGVLEMHRMLQENVPTDPSEAQDKFWALLGGLVENPHLLYETPYLRVENEFLLSNPGLLK